MEQPYSHGCYYYPLTNLDDPPSKISPWKETSMAQNQGTKEKTRTIGHYWQVQVLFLVLDFARSCQTSLPLRFLQSFLPAAIVIFFTGASVP